MDMVGGAETHRPQVVSLEGVEHLEERDPAPARGRHGEDLVPAVRPAQRGPPLGAGGAQGLACDETAVGLHLLLEEPRDPALVKPGGALLCDSLQRPREVPLPEQIAHLVGVAPARELGEGGGVRPHLRQRLTQRAGEAVGDHESLAGEGDGGSEELLPRKAAVLLPREMETGDAAGDPDREVARVVTIGGVGAVTEGHGRAGARGGRLGEVVDDRLAPRRAVEEEAAPADVARGRPDDRQREGGRHRGIDRVSARPEHLDAHLGGERVLGDDHPVAHPHRDRRRLRERGRGEEEKAGPRSRHDHGGEATTPEASLQSLLLPVAVAAVLAAPRYDGPAVNQPKDDGPALTQQELPGTFADLGPLAPESALDPGAGLWREGDAGDHVVLLLEGRLEVSHQTPEGEELVLRHLYPGAVAGEMAALDGQARSATVRARSPSRALSIPAVRFREFLRERPDVLEQLFWLQLERVRSLTWRVSRTHHRAITDPLTGLYNYGFFRERLAMELERAQLTGDTLALTIFDIDHFKHYNDTHGHQEGNKVLQKVAEILKQTGRRGDE